ncbi:peptide chain release factor 1-like [Triplophysa rosa]|uniref:peptide chain release factor 1-like n=1 Tax=Triplophysa rosa TaxID=992332 RepID=UPI002545DF7B|nr:peptide chain release factor 1-like [Triplophysa rosa]
MVKRHALLPKDKDDQKGVIIEIRAGTGGDEASLFASDLLHMYQKYSETKRWKFEIIEIKTTDLDGIKEVSAEISGNGVFSKLKFESGVHRVQRIPTTESSGRIHTSAATVAVLPQAEELDVEILDKDIRIDVYRSSGAGGQHVNTTDSAVRITHIPTGIVVCQQDEKSQHKNKAKALTILRTRVYALKREQYEAERTKERRSKIGSGDRSERIRTYNFPQGRVTDHRINFVMYELDAILDGSKLEIMLDKLIQSILQYAEHYKRDTKNLNILQNLIYQELHHQYPKQEEQDHLLIHIGLQI